MKYRSQIQKQLLHWYSAHHRRLPWRDTEDPYRIWVSEVMLQQTQVKTVLPYYDAFLERFPSVGHLARAEEQAVLKAWEGLGYYSRARNLHRAARMVVDSPDGRIPSTWRTFRELPGVGDYIAAAVLSIAFGQPHAVVDGNVKRVLARLQAMDTPVNQSSGHKIFQTAATDLLATDSPGTFNQALMELGALVCTPRGPNCPDCPLAAFCRAFQTDRVQSYPLRLARSPVPAVALSVGVVRRRNQLLIVRRRTDGLLGGMWVFPGGRLQAGEPADRACARTLKAKTGLQVRVESRLTTVKHAYTHFKIVMQVFECTWIAGRVRLNGPVDYRWIRPEEISQYPFPKANHKFIPLLRGIDGCGV